ACLLFSSSRRRRHTRFSRDWSSDVCSSDLEVLVVEAREGVLETGHGRDRAHRQEAVDHLLVEVELVEVLDGQLLDLRVRICGDRSEERRAGKACGARGRRWRQQLEATRYHE